MFRFIVPGVGPITVEASNPQEATRRMLQFLRSEGITLESGAEIAPPVRVTAGQAGDRFVRADDTSLGVSDELIDAARTGGTSPADVPVEERPGSQRPGGDIGVDIQDFPFASFANALQARGFDPDGVLGGTFRQGFDRLFPARNIGTAIGTIAPIGETPGASQAFFENNLQNQATLSSQVFDDLLRRTGQGQFEQFANPNLATQQGRNAFNDVRDLARAAAGNRFGSFIANRFLPSDTQFSEQFNRQLAGSPGGTQPSFLDFVNRAFTFS